MGDLELLFWTFMVGCGLLSLWFLIKNIRASLKKSNSPQQKNKCLGEIPRGDAKESQDE